MTFPDFPGSVQTLPIRPPTFQPRELDIRPSQRSDSLRPWRYINLFIYLLLHQKSQVALVTLAPNFNPFRVIIRTGMGPSAEPLARSVCRT